MSRQLIIAGSFPQASVCIVEHKLQSWEYVDSIEDLRGLRPGSTVWLYGTYYERKDYDELAEHCAAHDIGLVRV